MREQLRMTAIRIFAVLCLVLFAGSAFGGGDHFLDIRGKYREEGDSLSPVPYRCFTNGPPREHFLTRDREKPFMLPDAKALQGVVDTINILGIRVDFKLEDPDDPNTTGRGKFDMRNFDTFVAEEGHEMDPAPHNRLYFEAHMQALKRYWETVGDGHLVLNYEIWPRDVDSAFHLDSAMGYYGAKPPLEGLGLFFLDAVTVADSVGADSLDFLDDAGRKKAIIVFHAGSDRQNDIGFPPTTSDFFTGFITFDSGATVDNGAAEILEGIICPETASQDNRVTVLNAVLAHEFGHQLGLVDLYSTRTASFISQLGDFALMDNNGLSTGADFGFANVGRVYGTVPLYPMAWSRAFLGFENVLELQEGTDIELAAAEMATSKTRVARIPISDTEYYLLENRRVDIDGLPVGIQQDPQTSVILGPAIRKGIPPNDEIIPVREYDQFLPDSASGMVIWHVDEFVAWQDYDGDGIDNFLDNQLQWDKDRRFISLVEADGIIDFGGNYHAGYGTPQDLFYEGNNSEFSSRTNPASTANNGGYTHIKVDNISIPDTIMTFDVAQELSTEGFPRRTTLPFDLNLAPLAYDLDDDGSNEIIAASRNLLLAVKSDGSDYLFKIPAWQFTDEYVPFVNLLDEDLPLMHDTATALVPVLAELPSMISAQPVIAEFADTTLLFAATGNSFHAYFPSDSTPDFADIPNDGRAKLFWTRTAPFVSSLIHALIPDTASEDLYVLKDSLFLLVYAWDNPGGSGLKQQIPIAGKSVGAALTGSGLVVVTSVDNDTRLYSFVDTPTDLTLVDSLDIAEAGYHSPVVSDFNRDGAADVALVSRRGDVRWFTLAANGEITSLSQSFAAVGDTVIAPPSIADTDNDGYPELLFGGTNKIFAYNITGQLVADYPITIDRGAPEQMVLTSPIVSDVNGDGNADIIAATSRDNLYVVTPGRPRLDNYPVSIGIGFGIGTSGAPLHMKSGAGGMLVISSIDGWLRSWNTGWTDSLAMWPMAGGNAAGTAFFDAQETGTPDQGQALVEEFFNWPNPNTEGFTNIRVRTSREAHVKVMIFDAVGDVIKKFSLNADPAGASQYRWDLNRVPSGVYHCRLEATADDGSQREIRFQKIAVVK